MNTVNLEASWQGEHKRLLVYYPAINMGRRVSHSFLLFTILLNTNLHLDYLDWLRLMQRVKGKIQIKKYGCYGCFSNNKYVYEMRVDNFAGNPSKWGINVIKGDK